MPPTKCHHRHLNLQCQQDLKEQEQATQRAEEKLRDEMKARVIIEEKLRIVAVAEDDAGDQRTYEDKSLAITSSQYMFSKGCAIMKSGFFSQVWACGVCCTCATAGSSPSNIPHRFLTQARAIIEECYVIRKIHLYGDPLTADTLFVLAEIHREVSSI